MVDKGYIDFADINRPANKDGFKYLDWDKAVKICKENPNSTIEAGLAEDWGYTSDVIFQDGKFVKNEHGQLYAGSRWATPVLDIDGEVVECWKYENDLPEVERSEHVPDWWENMSIAG